MLILSGAYLSFRRSGLISGNRKAAHSERRPLWKRIPLRYVISVVFFCAIVVTTTYSCEEKRHIAASHHHTLGSSPIGPWTASLSRAAVVNLGGTTNYSLRVEAGAGKTANFKQATLRFTDSWPTPEPIVAFGQVHAMSAWVPTPQHLGKEVLIVLEIETWDGNRYLTEFPDTWNEAPRNSDNGVPATLEQHRIPDSTPFSLTFVSVLACFWAVTLSVGTVWIWIDRRIERTHI